jgi:hypothetical protein
VQHPHTTAPAPEATTARPPPSLRGAYHLAPVDRNRLVLGIEYVIRLGPRVTAELLIETTDDVPHLLRRLDDFRRLTPEAVAALGTGDWTVPLRPGRRPRRAA